MFSNTSVYVTSKLSPLGTGVPTLLASPTLGRNSGVGSSDPPVSFGSPALGSSGSVPLSERSMTTMGAPLPSVIGLPSWSTAVPEALTWLFSAEVVGLTITSNCSVKESPMAKSVPAAPELSMNWVAPLPSQALSIAITEAGSVGPVAKVKLPALTNAGPNWAAKSSTTDRFVRSVAPVFSMTTSYVTAKLPSG